MTSQGSEPSLALISVGNTRTRLALVAAGKLQPSRVIANVSGPTDSGSRGLIEGVLAGVPSGETPVLLASVNDAVATHLQQALVDRGSRVTRAIAPGAAGSASAMLGVTRVEVPIRCDLSPPITVGVDRLLNALAAGQRSGEACVVIDCGTAVTVDFVDKWGVFHGGCIAPGFGTSLRALHQHTAALPSIESREIKVIPVAPGKTTADAMVAGCAAAIRGMVHHLVEKYAEKNGSYPRVIATGGDAPLLLEHDDIVEHIVPDLTIMGLHATLDRVGQAS